MKEEDEREEIKDPVHIVYNRIYTFDWSNGFQLLFMVIHRWGA